MFNVFYVEKLSAHFNISRAAGAHGYHSNFIVVRSSQQQLFKKVFAPLTHIFEGF